MWSYLNRYRGSKSKIGGILGMWVLLLLITLPSIYFRPELFGMSNLVQMGVFCLGSFLSLLIIYKFFWGSAAWHHNWQTWEEDLPPFAKAHAQSKTGIIYHANTPKDKALIYKDAAFRFVCSFRYYLGYGVLAVATCNPFVVYLGKRGVDVAEVYIDEFTKNHDNEVIERIELKVGTGDGYTILKFASFTAIQTCGLIAYLHFV